jgi:hypothetical protein
LLSDVAIQKIIFADDTRHCSDNRRNHNHMNFYYFSLPLIPLTTMSVKIARTIREPMIVARFSTI